MNQHWLCSSLLSKDKLIYLIGMGWCSCIAYCSIGGVRDVNVNQDELASYSIFSDYQEYSAFLALLEALRPWIKVA